MTDGEAVPVADTVRLAVARHRHERGPLMVILHDVQAALGCVPPEAIPVLATELNLSRADVFGVVTFYRDFRSEPAGRRTVRICRAEACQSVGADAFLADASARLGVAPGATTADGEVTLSEVFCLGNCALGPSAEVDGRLYGRMDGARLDRVLSGGAR